MFVNLITAHCQVSVTPAIKTQDGINKSGKGPAPLTKGEHDVDGARHNNNNKLIHSVSSTECMTNPMVKTKDQIKIEESYKDKVSSSQYLGLTAPFSLASPDAADTERAKSLEQALKTCGACESEGELNHRMGVMERLNNLVKHWIKMLRLCLRPRRSHV